ncbi:TauD/TfdA family dioxygenase [Cryptosporangium arvum]|uniref:Taurine catabolism dioxygenase TauD, TfdA family n=1 Tax=Cryptosporangium arvum DSM 44712 TaxID=927661 RepID=A0A010ZVS4_9ACTN|nr:TauD/TfdA family dioxygenase [Cryptosporangium arvum]EXG82759.1 Taurine catabolism dioxygenase TauD, TfdA family [Cryptosporangium arvum DSM 44712]
MQPIDGPFAWRGSDLAERKDWIVELTAAQVEELRSVGERFVEDDPDLRTVTATDYPLPHCADAVAAFGDALDRGRGFVLVRGLPTETYDDALAGAIFYVMGLHLGVPMRQNELGDLLDHVIATSDKTLAEADALPSRVRDRLDFHSDSSDVVALMCLRAAKAGGASSLVSGATLVNEMLARRPDLAALLLEPWYFDWRKQDPDAPADYYTSPIVSWTGGVFSMYAGTSMIRSAQRHEGVPALSPEQNEALDLLDAITHEPGIALDMDFRPGDVQWLLNYAALHSRTSFVDHPEPGRRRHLLRLWLQRDVGRPLVPGFGKHVVAGREEARTEDDSRGHFHIADAVVPRQDWGQ